MSIEEAWTGEGTVNPSRQLGLLWGLVALTLIGLSPWASRLAAAAPACPVKSISHLPCPGCGSTRAAVALAELDPWTALTLNPLVACAWAGLVLGGLAALAISLTGRRLPTLPRRLPLAVRVLFVVVVAANWLYLVLAGV